MTEKISGEGGEKRKAGERSPAQYVGIRWELGGKHGKSSGTGYAGWCM